jgi:hypothetical protein
MMTQRLTALEPLWWHLAKLSSSVAAWSHKRLHFQSLTYVELLRQHFETIIDGEVSQPQDGRLHLLR